MDGQAADQAGDAFVADTASRLAARPHQSLAERAEVQAQALARLHTEAEVRGERGPDLDLMAESLRTWARRLRG